MAKVTGGFTSYQAVGNRESLLDIIYNIDPFETPFLNGIAGKDSVMNRTFDWQTDGLPSAVSAQQEGFAVAPVVQSATTRSTNVTMILSNNATVSKTQQKVNSAGRADDLSYQMARISKALKRDVEAACLSNSARVDGDDSGPTARVTRGVEHWIQSNKNVGTSYAYTNATTAMTDGTVRTFTEAFLSDVLEQAWVAGGSPDTILLGSKMKKKFSGFSGRSFTRTGGDVEAIIGAAEIYISDWGPVKAVPCRNVRGRTALALDGDYISVAYLRPFETMDLPVSGDAVSKMLTVEFGVRMANEKACGKVADLDVNS